MDNMLYPSEENMLITLIYHSSNTLKAAFVYLRGNLGNLPNKRRPEVAAEIIWRLNVWILVNYYNLWGGHHQHHVPPLLFIISI